MTVWWRRTFLAAAVAWALVLLVAPLAAQQQDAGGMPLAFAYAAYQIGHIVCHQLPERSFQWMSTPLPVCARCTGIYMGAAFAAILGAAWEPATAGAPAEAGHDARTGTMTARTVLAAAALPTLATLVYEWTTGDIPSHWTRAATGGALGAAVAWIIRDVN